MRRILTILFALLLPASAWVAAAHGDDVRFESIDSKLLPSNYVKSLFQDSEGYIWVATSSGLVRYDGHSTKSYTECMDEYSFIHELVEDCDSRLILATDNGLMWLDKNTGTTEAFVTDSPLSCLAVDRKLNIWAGGEDGLFCRQFGESELTQVGVRVQGQDVKGIIDVVADSNGNIWLTTWQKGLYVYNPSTGHTQVFKNGLLAYSYIIYQDSSDNIWVGTWGHGLLRLSDDFMTSSSYVSYPTVSAQGDILYDEVIYAINDINGKILIGGQKGFSIMEPEKGECTFYSHGTQPGDLPYNQVNSILVTRNRNVYLGLYGGGMCQIDFPERPYDLDRMEVMRRKLGTSTIYGISDAGNGAYWMGVADNAFVLFDPSDGSVTRYNEIAGFEDLTSISAAFAIRKRGVTEEICFGTYSEGLWVYDPNAGNVKVFSTQTHPVMLNNSILSLENDTCGNLWIGTHSGAYILTPSDELMTLHDFLPCDETAHLNDQIHGLAASADGRMFLATLQNGIVEVDVQSKEVQCHMTSGKPIPFSNILVDRDGHVWAGTLTDGLYVLDIETGNLRKADLVRGLESQCITNLMQSADGEIWVATTNEVLSFECKGFGQIDVTRCLSDLALDFCSNAGLLSDQMLILGTTDGMFTLELQKLDEQRSAGSTLVISEIILNGVPYTKKELKVREGDNVEIRYTLLDDNSHMTPIYRCTCNGTGFATVEESIVFTVGKGNGVVVISHELSGQVLEVEVAIEEDSYLWVILAIGAVLICLFAAIIWQLKRIRARKSAGNDVISFEINSIKFESADQQLLSQAMEVIHANLNNSDFKQEDFIRQMGMSRTQLTDKLKELTGFTPISLIMEVRLKTAYNTIMEAESKLRVSDVAYSVGFNDAKYFSTCFRKKYGVTPKELLAQRIEKLAEEK